MKAPQEMRAKSGKALSAPIDARKSRDAQLKDTNFERLSGCALTSVMTPISARARSVHLDECTSCV